MFIIILENGGKYYIESENKKIFSIDIFYRISSEIEKYFSDQWTLGALIRGSRIVPSSSK